VLAGLATTFGPVVVFKFVAGLQVNVVALFAVSVTFVPAHMLPPVAVMVGFGQTVNVYTAWLVQVPAVPRTVIVATTELLVTGGVTVSGLLFKLGLPLNPAGKVHT
jgi:hypothetical protein